MRKSYHASPAVSTLHVYQPNKDPIEYEETDDWRFEDIFPLKKNCLSVQDLSETEWTV